MKGKTHITIGLSTFLLLLPPSPSNLIVLSGYTILGSLVPDIDTEYGLIHSSESILLIITIFIYTFIAIPFKTLSFIGTILFIFLLNRSASFNHRTFTHSIIGIIVFSLPILLMSPRLLVPFNLGYCMHLFADSFTKSGVPLFLPYNKKKYGPKLIKSSGECDSIIYFLTFFLTLFIIFKTYTNEDLLISIQNFFLPILNLIFKKLVLI
ncbi:metal-dependent hydrolase [Clostridium cadaveris]|uniref:metal-dependent hydrolase n=1 Tax=Clostridium cadaveris TaxID=1529 RepID=UPI003995A6AA